MTMKVNYSLSKHTAFLGRIYSYWNFRTIICTKRVNSVFFQKIEMVRIFFFHVWMRFIQTHSYLLTKKLQHCNPKNPITEENLPGMIRNFCLIILFCGWVNHFTVANQLFPKSKFLLILQAFWEHFTPNNCSILFSLNHSSSLQHCNAFEALYIFSLHNEPHGIRNQNIKNQVFLMQGNIYSNKIWPSYESFLSWYDNKSYNHAIKLSRQPFKISADFTS